MHTGSSPPALRLTWATALLPAATTRPALAATRRLRTGSIPPTAEPGWNWCVRDSVSRSDDMTRCRKSARRRLERVINGLRRLQHQTLGPLACGLAANHPSGGQPSRVSRLASQCLQSGGCKSGGQRAGHRVEGHASCDGRARARGNRHTTPNPLTFYAHTFSMHKKQGAATITAGAARPRGLPAASQERERGV